MNGWEFREEDDNKDLSTHYCQPIRTWAVVQMHSSLQTCSVTYGCSLQVYMMMPLGA